MADHIMSLKSSIVVLKRTLVRRLHRYLLSLNEDASKFRLKVTIQDVPITKRVAPGVRASRRTISCLNVCLVLSSFRTLISQHGPGSFPSLCHNRDN